MAVLRLRDRIFEVSPSRPLVMAVLNASPESFSDGAGVTAAPALVERGLAMVGSGAHLVDVGGESGVTDRPAVDATEEIRRVVPVVRGLVASGAVVSVDTWKRRVARAVLDAGAHLVNDVSGMRDPGIAEDCARHGAGLVVMHTRSEPKRKEFPSYDDVVADVVSFLREHLDLAMSHGVEGEQLVVDPGPDFAKTPTQTVEVLRRLRDVASLGRPVLLALSRKDFVGALTGRSPRGRLPGTLAALAHGLDHGGSIVRVHDVAETLDWLRVRAALRGDLEVPPDLRLPDELRREH